MNSHITTVYLGGLVAEHSRGGRLRRRNATPQQSVHRREISLVTRKRVFLQAWMTSVLEGMTSALEGMTSALEGMTSALEGMTSA